MSLTPEDWGTLRQLNILMRESLEALASEENPEKRMAVTMAIAACSLELLKLAVKDWSSEFGFRETLLRELAEQQEFLARALAERTIH